MSLVLAVEPDNAQASILKKILRGRIDAEVLVVSETAAAIQAIHGRVPDLVLVSSLLSPREEDALFAHLRSLDGASHLQTLTIPQLRRGKKQAADGAFSVFRKKKVETTATGCDPALFVQEVESYLARAHELKAHPPVASPINAPPPPPEPAHEPIIQEPVVPHAVAPDALPADSFDSFVSDVPETISQSPVTGSPITDFNAGFESFAQADSAPALSSIFDGTPAPSPSTIEPRSFESVPPPLTFDPVVPALTLEPAWHQPNEMAVVSVEETSVLAESRHVGATAVMSSADEGWVDLELDRLINELGLESSRVEVREREADLAHAEAAAQATLFAEIERVQQEAEERRRAELARLQAEAEEERLRAVNQARADAEEQARNALAAELARVRQEAEQVLAEAEAAKVKELERVQAEAEQARLDEVARLQAEADERADAAARQAHELAEAAQQAREAAEAQVRQARQAAEAETRQAREVAEAAEQARDAAEIQARQAREAAEADARQARELAEAAQQARAAAEAQAREVREAAEIEARQAREAAQLEARQVRAAAEAEAQKAMASELARVRAEVEKTLNGELERARADADALHTAELTRVQAEADAMRVAAAENARVNAEAAASRALETEVNRVRAEAEARLKNEIETIRQEAARTRQAEQSETRQTAEKVREAALRDTRAIAEAANQTLESEIRRVRAEADAKLAAELAKARAEAEQQRNAELEEIKSQVAEMREAAALHARTAAAEAIAQEVKRATAETPRVVRKAPNVVKLKSGSAPVVSPRHALPTPSVARHDTVAGHNSGATASVSPPAAGQDSVDYYNLWKEETPPPPAPVASDPEAESESAFDFSAFIDIARTKKFVWPAAAALLLVLGGGYAANRFWKSDTVAAQPAAVAEPEPTPAPVTPAARLGEIVVEATPAGAAVSLDGVTVGKAPLKLSNVKPGKHTIVLQSSSGAITRKITVKPGETAHLSESIFSGWIAIFSGVPLTISIDGKPHGTTDDGQITLAPGNYNVELSSERFNYHEAKSVHIEPGQIISYSVKLPVTPLHLDAPDGMEVSIDGQSAGVTPLSELTVPIGTHEIAGRGADGAERRKSVEAKADEPAQVNLR